MINVYIIGPPLTGNLKIFGIIILFLKIKKIFFYFLGKKSIINHLHSQLSTELSSLMSCVGNITFCESILQCPRLCETSEDIIIYLAGKFIREFYQYINIYVLIKLCLTRFTIG